MSSHDFTLLAGHVYIAASLLIFGLGGNRRIGTTTAVLGVCVGAVSLIAKTVSL